MKESQGQNTIDLFVAFLRKLVDSSRGHWDDCNKQILLVFGIDDHNKLNFIIDSLYLIEDTQLAKLNFREFGASGPTKYKNFGEVYLRIYGIYNACYLQK